MKNAFNLELNGGTSNEDVSKQKIPESVNDEIVSDLKKGILKLENSNDEFKLNYCQNDDESIDLSIHLPNKVKFNKNISLMFSNNADVGNSSIDETLWTLNIMTRIAEVKDEVYKLESHGFMNSFFGSEYFENEDKQADEEKTKEESKKCMIKISSLIDDVFKLGKITKTSCSKSFLVGMIIKSFIITPPDPIDIGYNRKNNKTFDVGYIIDHIPSEDSRNEFLNELVEYAKKNRTFYNNNNAGNSPLELLRWC